jgi:DNA helicase-2/ATP-dependent DNA helicase PcrA
MSSFRLFDYDRGSVVAPAGCGKTQAIVDALMAHEGAAALILTHTNAGVAALKARLGKAQVPGQRFRLSTIDGWAMRLVRTFPRLSAITIPDVGRIDYPAIQRAALRVVAGGALDAPLQATYSRLVVDEYQDCSKDQHAIILSLAERLKTCVLGDPLQRIFDFRPSEHPNWEEDVESAFTQVGTFDVPWRWENAGQRSFGEWVLSVRPALLSGAAIDLRRAPANVTWVHLPADPGALQVAQSRAVSAIRTAAGQGVLIVGDSRNPRSRSDFARKTPGLNVVEPVDLGDLVEAAAVIQDCASLDRLRATLEFAALVMTEVDIAGLGQRLNSLHAGRARNPADAVETACLRFAHDDGFATVNEVLRALAASSRRTFRHHLLSAMFDALTRVIKKPGLSLVDAAVAAREQGRVVGRALPRRAVGSTLLLKGLEAEHAVILNADQMNARHFYVAISRASHSLTIFSNSPVVQFR